MEDALAPKTLKLAMGDLELLAQLHRQLREAEAERLVGSSLEEPPKVTFERFADGMGVVSTTVRNALRRIEESLGTYLVPRVDKLAPKVQRRKVKSKYPEDTEGFGGVPGEGRMEPELTLDGEIWALYADLVLRLHSLTKRATAPYPRPVPTGATRRINLGQRPVRLDPPPVPVRPPEASRARFLTWLQHQHELIAQAEDFLRDNRHANPCDLQRLIPGFQADPNEEALWDPDDVVPEYASDDAEWNEGRG